MMIMMTTRTADSDEDEDEDDDEEVSLSYAVDVKMGLLVTEASPITYRGNVLYFLVALGQILIQLLSSWAYHFIEIRIHCCY